MRLLDITYVPCVTLEIEKEVVSAHEHKHRIFWLKQLLLFLIDIEFFQFSSHCFYLFGVLCRYDFLKLSFFIFLILFDYLSFAFLLFLSFALHRTICLWSFWFCWWHFVVLKGGFLIIIFLIWLICLLILFSGTFFNLRRRLIFRIIKILDTIVIHISKFCK